MIMEAGAPAVPVAEVATEVNAVPDQRRWATAWWKYFHLEGQGIASLQRHVGVRGRRCQPTQHGVSGGLSPIVRRRDASAAGFLALRHCTHAMRQHDSWPHAGVALATSRAGGADNTATESVRRRTYHHDGEALTSLPDVLVDALASLLVQLRFSFAECLVGNGERNRNAAPSPTR